MPARKKTRSKASAKTKARRKARSKARSTAGMAHNPRKKAAKNSAKNSAKKSAKKAPMSKKVGRWRVEQKGRSVYAAGAKHAYASAEVARTVYKKITSLKSVEAFVKRYGTKKTQAAVLGLSKTRKAPKKKAASKRRTRRNAPISRSEADAAIRMLRRHGYRIG